MIIFPAIDIKDGKCVRLEQGRVDRVTVFSEDPVYVAKLFEDKGAKYLHIVDLDGAFQGIRQNRNVISKLINNIDIPIELGGGIRTLKDIEDALEIGVKRVILGTSVIEVDGFLEEALGLYGDKIAVSIDALNGKIALKGWTSVSDIRADYYARVLENMGLKTIIYTDISKDGMLSGPNFQELSALSKVVNMDIIASGGISITRDINRLSDLGLKGAIIGKALYTGSIRLEEILG